MSIFEISIFGIQIAPSWYGLMYALGFIWCYEYVRRNSTIRPLDMESLLFSIFIWVIAWWRIGYVFLYNFEYFLSHPLEIFAVWQGGMSFHGWALWVILMIFLFAWRKKYRVFDVSDPIVTILPLALWLGRIGNLINKELLGFTPYSGPFAIAQHGIAHFPSPLLEAILEWIILLIIMFSWKSYEKKTGRKAGYASAIFLFGYGIFRLFSEFFRLPDAHIGYLFWTEWITLGMIYTLPMIVGSIVVFIVARRNI